MRRFPKWSVAGRVLAVLLLQWAALSAVFADQTPVARPPDVKTLTVTKDAVNGTVVLSWSDGAAPFSVARSETPRFTQSASLAYVTRATTSGPVADPVLNDGKIYFYVVSDANAPTRVFSIKSGAAVAHEGATAVVDGVGFSSDCSNDKVYLASGLEAPLSACSATQIQAQIPAHALSGDVVVVSPNGSSVPQATLFAVGVSSNPAKTRISHINVDNNHNLFACDQGTSNRIWKIDFGTGSAATCATFANPVGLPRNENGKFLYGNDTWDSLNVGSVRELDPAACSYVTWGAAGTTSDAVDPRALAYDKSGANNGWVFVLDHRGDRIRRKANGAEVDTNWLSKLGLGGDGDAASRPAGFAFNTSGEFFFTAQGTIRHYSSTKSLIQSFSAADGLNHPAQIETDGSGALWVANQGADNVLKIRTDPANRLVLTKVEGVTAPRGVALDRDPTTNKPWLYVADATEVYRFPLSEQSVHLDIKIVSDALQGPDGVYTPPDEFEKVVRDQVASARAALAQCGVGVILDGISFIPDPNSSGGQVPTTGSCQGYPLKPEDTLLTTSRSARPNAINIYYVRNFTIGNATAPLVGYTYTSDCFAEMQNRTHGGIIIARYSPQWTGGLLAEEAGGTTQAHEITHFLMHDFVNDPGPGEHHGAGQCTDPDAKYLMFRVNCPQAWLLTPNECSAMTTNSEEDGFFLELF